MTIIPSQIVMYDQIVPAVRPASAEPDQALARWLDATKARRADNCPGNDKANDAAPAAAITKDLRMGGLQLCR